MTHLFSTDSFDAFSTANGIFIKEKKKSAKKIGLLITAAGAVFLVISFIDLSTIVPEAIYKFFFYTFRWGGIVLAVSGAVTFIAKGLLSGNAEVTVDKEKREINLRGKIIPFAQVNSVNSQAVEVFGKQMTFIILDHQGKKRPLVSGSFLSAVKDDPALAAFVRTVNDMVKG